MKLFLPSGDNSLAERVVAVRQLVAFLEGITTSKVTSDIFFYLLEHGAATAWLLQVDLNQPEASVYRGLKRLRKLDVIVGAFKITTLRGSGGGPRTKVWALQGADAGEVADAIRKHHRALSPKYRVAEEMVQSILEDTPRIYERNEVNYRELVNYLKIQKMPFRRNDVAEMMTAILREKGIKVWL